MKFQNVKVYNFEGALRGMRNPKNSWHLSDSFFGLADMETTEADYIVAEKWVQKDYPDYPMEENPEAERLYEVTDDWLLANGVLERDEYNSIANCAFIGPNDMHLAQTLIKSGPEHRKFLRQIMVCVDITAPLYWWKEFDTYKVGSVANSCSTMHKIQEKEFTWDDFSYEHLFRVRDCKFGEPVPTLALETTINALNYWREKYLAALKTEEETGLPAKDIWWQMIQLLPSSYNQTRNVMMNYEVLANIYKSRKNHKLDEWREFCKWIEELPYSELIVGKEED